MLKFKLSTDKAQPLYALLFLPLQQNLVRISQQFFNCYFLASKIENVVLFEHLEMIKLY